MGFENPIVGGTVLRIPAIQSPNYSPGVAGWIIKINGDAEFNNLTIRGEFIGNNFIIDAAGIFLYSGTPANGNLIGSWANASGTDTFGNTYPQGLSIGSNITRQIVMNYNGSAAAIAFSVNNGNAQTSGGIVEKIENPTLVNEFLSLQVAGPTVKTFTDGITLQLNSQNEDGSSDANTQFRHSAFGALQVWDPTASTVTVPLVYTDTLIAGTVDMGRGLQSSVQITANVTGITGTEVVLMTLPSMTFKNNRAYRVTLWGLAQSTTASTYFLYRLRKGSATTTGTIYRDQLRVPTLPVASTNSAVAMTFGLTNTSGADVTTALTWTGSCAAGTGQFSASASLVAHATVEDVGLAAAWPGAPVT